MMLTESAIDRVILLAALPMLAGVGCWFGGLAITGVMLVGLGAMAGSFAQYRTEHGIWMLGSLFFAIFTIFYVGFVYFSVVDAIAGRRQFGFAAIDVALATSTIGFMVRFLWSVTCLNRRLVPFSGTNQHDGG